MPSVNSGRQYDKQHAVTIVAAVALAANRFVAYNGGYPTNAGGATDCQGVTEYAAAAGEAVSAITGYSAPVEAAMAIPFGATVQTDAQGRAIVGGPTDHFGRALSSASAAGQLVEVQIVSLVAPTGGPG